MLVLPIGPYSPVAPIAPAAPIAPRKAKAAEKSADRAAATRPARSATVLASHSTRAALDDMKLGG
jgi:hypothetical protein